MRPMNDPTLKQLYAYSDWSNAAVTEAASHLSDDQLDRPLDRHLRPLEQQLPCQQRPIELPRAEDLLSHDVLTRGAQIRGSMSPSKSSRNRLGSISGR